MMRYADDGRAAAKSAADRVSSPRCAWHSRDIISRDTTRFRASFPAFPHELRESQPFRAKYY